MARAASREGAKPTQRSHDGRKASTQSVSMKVAKASLSQMPSHHPMVTRSPNHMWASSWATTSATRSSSARAARGRIDQQRGVAEGDAAQVLHGAGGEVGDGHQVHLLARVGDVEVLGEEAQGEGADGQGEVGQLALARGEDDPQRHAVDVDRLGRLELADDEGHQVGRHLHGGREAHDVLVAHPAARRRWGSWRRRRRRGRRSG